VSPETLLQAHADELGRSDTISPGLSIKDIEGVWVSGDSLQKLHDTLSPHASQPYQITIRSIPRSEGFQFAWTNFHEGSWRLVSALVREEKRGMFHLILGPVERAPAGESDLMRVPLRMGFSPDGRVKTIRFPQALDAFCIDKPYVRIPVSWWQYVNRLVFSGKWKSQKSGVITFSESGKGKGPDGQLFTYKVSLDATEVPKSCDLVTIQVPNPFEPGVPQEYGFKRTRDQLFIYGSTPNPCANSPFLVLKKQ
jgi:hypothetical protein